MRNFIEGDMMKVLIAYYSRTGNTEKIAEIIKDELNADIERIDDGDKYKGPIGYMKGGFNAVTGRLNEIKPTEKNPLHYDLTIIGSPVWASSLAPGVSQYIRQNRKNFTNVAGFVSCGSGGGEKTLKQMSDECGKQLKASLILNSEDMKSDLNKKINTFINKI